MDQQQADRTDRMGQMALIFRGAEAGMNEAHGPIVFSSENQAVTIEVGLGKNHLFKPFDRHRLGQALVRRGRPPDFDQFRRVGVLERAVLDHGYGVCLMTKNDWRMGMIEASHHQFR